MIRIIYVTIIVVCASIVIYDFAEWIGKKISQIVKTKNEQENRERTSRRS